MAWANRARNGLRARRCATAVVASRSTRSLDVIRVSGRAKRILAAVVIGVVVGAAYPFIDLSLSCRAPASEACVWGKAYLSLSLGISIPVIGSIVAALAYALMAWRTGKAQEHDDV